MVGLNRKHITSTGMTCCFIAIALAFASPMLAQTPAELVFSPGPGAGQLGTHLSPEGPNSGPLSVLISGNGLVILDSFNSRLVRIDETGASKGLIPLPPGGLYKDMARLPNGQIWVIDEQKRAALRISGGGVQRVFELPGDGQAPHQIDALVGLGDHLAVIDYRSQSAFFFQPTGEISSVASVPTALAFVADSRNRLCFLALRETEEFDYDPYDRLIRLSADGTLQETRLPGKTLFGARLLGFTPDDRPIILTVETFEPMKRRLFVQNSDGSEQTLGECLHPLLFAARYASVGSNSLWLNFSAMDGQKLVFKRFDLK